MRRRALMAAITLVLAATSARAGVSLLVDQPTGPNVTLRWDSDGAGPFTLLQRDLADTRTTGELPLDPAADAVMTGIAGRRIVLIGAALFDAGTRMKLFQVIDESDGSCSNVGFVVLRQGFTAGDVVTLFRPPRSSVRSLGEALDAFPSISSVSRLDVENCREVRLSRDGSGRKGTDGIVPMGSAIVATIGVTADLVLAGASDRPDHVATTWSYAASCAIASDAVAVPWGADGLRADDLLCGAFTDADADGRPDTCTNGWFDGVHDATLVSAIGRHRRVLPFGGSLLWDGSSFEVDPVAGLTVEIRGGDADPPLLASVVVHDAGAPSACRCVDSDGDGDDDCTERLSGTDPSNPASHGPDFDADGVPDDDDDCPMGFDPAQQDTDGDALPDACDPDPLDPQNLAHDPDGDGIFTDADDCPLASDPLQRDADSDGRGDACDSCPLVADDGSDADRDGLGNACDTCPLDATPDVDLDRHCSDDNCPTVRNGRQSDADGDGWGDACDCDDRPVEPDVLVLTVTGVAGHPEYGCELLWDPVPGFVFDVVTGLVSDLFRHGTVAEAHCLARRLTDPFCADVAPGTSWYLVRYRGPCVATSWGGGTVPWRNPVGTLDEGPIAGCP